MPTLPDVVTGLFATAQGPCVEVAHEKVYRIVPRVSGKTGSDVSTSGDSVLQSTDLTLSLVSGRPLASEMSRLVSARFAPGTAPVLTSYLTGASGLVTQSTSLSLPVPENRSVEHLLSVDGDLSRGLIVGARLLDDNDSSGPATLLLTRFLLGDDGVVRTATTPDGAVDTLLLDDSSTAYVGLPYTVAPDGRVIQPVATEVGYAIFVHAFPSADTSTQGTEVQP
jgi:hypothetical protein